MKAVLIGLFVSSAMSVLCEMILPDGKLKKTARFFIGIVAATVAFSPVYSFIKKDLLQNLEINGEVVSSAEDINDLENDIEKYFDLLGVDVEVKIYTYQGKTCFALFSTDEEHSEYVKKAISSILGIDEDKVCECL